MKHHLQSTIVVLAAAGLISACGAPETEINTQNNQPEIGASLNEKAEVAIADLPDGVLSTAQAVRPNVNFTEAEREVRNGVIYFDVGGEDENGDEIELDIMQDGDGWTVVEIQRDITLAQTPMSVRETLEENAPGVVPARIIESDQTDGVIIYEFFTRADDGTETKYEVKFENGEAEFLIEEWVH